jgi:hypothetical protein
MDAEEITEYVGPTVEIVQNGPVSNRTDLQGFYYDPDFMGPQIPPPPKEEPNSWEETVAIILGSLVGMIICGVAYHFFVRSTRRRYY